MQGRVCPSIHTSIRCKATWSTIESGQSKIFQYTFLFPRTVWRQSGARQPDRLFVVSLAVQVESERLDKFPFSMSSPFCHFLYLYLLREDFSIFHSLAILHLLARLSKSFWIWIWIRAYNVQSSSSPFLDKIQLNFVISLPWVRFKSQHGYKLITENWEHQTWDFSVVAFRCFVQIPCIIDSLLPSSSLLYVNSNCTPTSLLLFPRSVWRQSSFDKSVVKGWTAPD